MADIPQVSFSSGEISPSLYGRIDFNRYYTGLKTCRNFIVRPMGGVCNRPPFLAFVDGNESAVRIVPFQVSATIGYVLEFSTNLINIYRDGILYDSVVTSYAAADIPLIKHVQNNDIMTLTHSSYTTMQLKHYAATNWVFEPFVNVTGPFQDLNIDKSIALVASSDIGLITLTSTSNLFLPYQVGQLLYIEQAPDYSTRRWEAGKTISAGDIRRANSNTYLAQTSGTTGTIMPTVLEGSETDGDPGIFWAYLHSGFGIVRIESVVSPTEATATVISRLPAQFSVALAPKPITGIQSSDHDTTQIYLCVNHDFVVGDHVILTFADMSTKVIEVSIVTGEDSFKAQRIYNVNDANDEGTTATLQVISSEDNGSTYKWAFEAWKGDTQYPATSAYYQQRQVFASTPNQPTTVWMSETAGYTSFNRGIPIQDDNGITFTVASTERSEIRHLIELSKLLMLTSTGEWVITGNQDGVLTPTNVNVKRQGYCGSSHLQPLTIDSYALFVQEKGNQIRSLGYSFADDSFMGKDLTIVSNHLFQGFTIVSWAYQKIPFSCVWAVRSDGQLLCLTYAPEHEVIGWSRHDTTGGLIKSVCCLSEHGADVLYLLIDRNGIRYIEKMDVRYPSTATTAWMDRGNIPYVQEIETLEINPASGNLRDKQKLIPHVTILCEEGYNLQVGADSDNLFPVSTKQHYTHGTVDVRVSATWNKGGNIVIRNNGNEACTILGIIPEVTTGGS